MNCPSCAKPLPANSSKCPACGKTASLLPETYDLLPEEPAKKAEADPFAPPEGLLNASAPAAAPAGGGTAKPPRAPLRPTDWTPHTSGFEVNKGMIMAGGLLLLVVGGMVWKTCGPEPSELKGRTKAVTFQPFQLAAERFQTIPFEVKGSATYKFEVASDEGEFLIGVVARNPKIPPTLASLKASPEGLIPVVQKNTRTIEGELKSGTYAWVIVNDTKKIVRGRMKYLAQID
ncbi:MAG TPA: hypothetical protein VEJ18_13430 [Planctomycetota bacterium]|nr:hypothetical protein [Planctomycetota bacterium]